MPRPRSEDVDRVMSEDEYPLQLLGDPTTFEKSPTTTDAIPKRYRKRWNYEEESETPLMHRLPSVQTTLRPNFGTLRNSFRKLNCFNCMKEEEEMPIMDLSRHKSIDIGVGLARRMSLFIFTKKTVCVHPYHPYTPTQTTRKIYIFSEDKH